MKLLHSILTMLAIMVRMLWQKAPPIGRLIKFSQHPFIKRGHAHVEYGNGSLFQWRPLAIGTAVLFVVLLVAGFALMHYVGAHAGGGALLADVAVLTRRDLKTVLTEAKAIQDKYQGKRWPEEDAKKFDDLTKEAEEIQKDVDREARFAGVQQKAGTIPEPTLPAQKTEPEQKAEEHQIVGYLTLGEAIVRSPEFREFAAKGFPKIAVPVLSVPAFEHGLVPLTRKQRQMVENEIKSVPSLGAGVIEPQRLSDFVQVTADDETVLRTILNVSRTNSNTVEYLREESFTRAAAPTAEGVGKPEAALAYTIQNATVRTIAVWIPATVQMLADFPSLRNMIDGRLLYDLRKEEEELVMYGDGQGQNFLGIIPTPGLHNIATVAAARGYSFTPTIIDKVRIGMTEVRRSGYQPNALLIHPIDWEAILLTKGDDDHYLRQVFPDSDGNLRVWGLTAVESVATEENAGNPTEERNYVVGDFRRGATLWMREDASVLIGMQNDDLTKNLRTVLAEERAAFAVQAAKAFAYETTQASST